MVFKLSLLVFILQKFQRLMSEEEENFLKDESIQILSLFRKRTITSFSFSLQKYRKLYDNLCCTICRELFTNPVYLKCSHRFCKQCIEKHIRLNEKKSCPNCRGGLATKRDLRSDFMLISMMTYAFADLQHFKKKIQICEEEANQKLVFVKTKNSIQCLEKRERPESHNKQYNQQNRSPKKRETRQNSSLIKKDSQIHEEEKERKQIDELRPAWGRTINKRDRKKKNNEIESGSEEKKQNSRNENEDNAVHLSQEFILRNEISLNSPKVTKDQNQEECVLENLKKEDQETKKREESKQIVKQQQIFENSNPQKQSQKQKNSPQIMIDEKQEQNRILSSTIQDKELLRARSLLLQEYNEKYIFKLIANYKAVVKIKLQRVPKNPFTPLLPHKFVVLTTKCLISDIAKIIAYQLNIQNRSVVRLFSQNNGSFQQIINRKKSILEFNNEHWQTYKGLSIFSIENILQTPPSNFERILYYMVSYDTLIKK